MESRIIFRRAVENDAEQIIQHTRKVLEENAQFMGTSIEEFKVTIEREKEWIRAHDERGFLMVAVVDGQIIGALNFQPSFKKKFAHQGMFGMSIQEAYTNQGIGRTFIEKLLAWAKENQEIEKVSLEVFSNNKRAIHLYKKMGFVEEGRRVRNAKLGPNNYVDDIIMSQFV